MAVQIILTVNGVERRITTEPSRTLLEVLREDLGLTGTKYGCGEGACRACTVLLEGKPAQSCRTPIESVKNAKVETIESLANGDQLHPVQAAFLQAEAMQCGYCVPGMIMSTVALLRAQPKPSREQIVQALDGNLCRCCGYLSILNAVERAVAK